MTSSSCWWNLPEDLVIDQILSRLPVKSLMRFKSVCKRWYSFPTNPSFIASHLKHNTTCNSLASWNANIGPMFENIFSLRFYSLAFQPVNLNFGLDRKPDLVLGPCDGLFCLYWKHPRDYPRYGLLRYGTLQLGHLDFSPCPNSTTHHIRQWCLAWLGLVSISPLKVSRWLNLWVFAKTPVMLIVLKFTT